MIYHDLAGWLMMPLALTMLWLELKFLAHLWIEDSSERGASYQLSAFSYQPFGVGETPRRSGRARLPPSREPNEILISVVPRDV